MPVLDQNGVKEWRRRTTGESLVRWFGWLVGVFVWAALGAVTVVLLR